jgi:hypothetical protein
MVNLLIRGLGAILLFLVAMAAMATSHDEEAYNGWWWLHVPLEQQTGYINGDEDCYKFDMHKNLANSKSAREIAQIVTHFYETKGNENTSVFVALREADRHPSQEKSSINGEVWRERHGYWDGQWWREGSPFDRLGFVQGFLACHKEGNLLAKKFSKTAEEYVILINGWYGLNEKTGASNPEREDIKIADVISRFIY